MEGETCRTVKCMAMKLLNRHLGYRKAELAAALRQIQHSFFCQYFLFKVV